MQIVILIFAFCAFAGSWAARRRSPLYSHKTTIKLIGAFLLMADYRPRNGGDLERRDLKFECIRWLGDQLCS